VQETALATEQAVGLHAPRWGDPSLAEISALQPSGPERAELLEQYYRGLVSPCIDRLGHRFDADVTARWRASPKW